MAPNTITNAINNPVVLNPVLVIIKFHSVVTKLGNPEIIPIKIIIEIPFPIPLFVISSPSHINIDVPATSDITTRAPVENSVFTNIPEDLYDTNTPIASIKANTNVSIFVYLLIFFLPSSPPS